MTEIIDQFTPGTLKAIDRILNDEPYAKPGLGCGSVESYESNGFTFDIGKYDADHYFLRIGLAESFYSARRKEPGVKGSGFIYSTNDAYPLFCREVLQPLANEACCTFGLCPYRSSPPEVIIRDPLNAATLIHIVNQIESYPHAAAVHPTAIRPAGRSLAAPLC